MIPSQAIDPPALANTGPSSLFRYDFSNGQIDSLVRLTLYTKEKNPDEISLEDGQQAIDRILKPYGLWSDADGIPHNVGIEWLGRFEK